MATATWAAKPYGRHRPPNTPTSGLTKNVIKSVKGNNKMFLLVSGRHVGGHPDEHQHGVSIQNSVNLGYTLLRIARVLETAKT